MAIAAPLNTLVIFDSPQFFITFQNELSANNINLGACLLHDQDSLQKALEKAWDIVLRPLHPDESGLAQWRQQSQARDRLHRVLDASPDIVFMLTLDGKLLYNNEACRVQFGLDQGALQTAASLLDILPPKFSQQLALQILPMLKNTGEWKGDVLIDSNNQSQPESILSLVCFSHQGPADSQPYLSFVGRDISQQKQLERALLHQATHDELTTLPNRHSLLDHLQDAFARSRRSGKSVALLFMDVDKFKRINDSLGHLAGDELLRQTALRLRSCLRANDLVSRLGGDEFTISIEDLEQPEDVITVISKIYQVFTLPIDVHGQELFVSLSTGIALFPQDANSVTDLLRCADIAMYQAKAKGAGCYQFYSSDMETRGREVLQLEADLRYALANGEFVLYYQPQISLKQGKVIGVEALLRWQHPTRGLIPPGEFIPLLELTGLIIKVGNWVIREASECYQRLAAAGLPSLHITVNVSAVQFQQDRFLQTVLDISRDTGLPAGKLILEVTENILIHNPERAAKMLFELGNNGVQAAIDDFGTGYSSLAYLKQLPLAMLKIDRTFIRDIDSDPNDAAIVQATISMAHKLGLNVIAEGVEIPTQFDFLKGLSCDAVQGFMFAQPLSEPDLMEYLQTPLTVTV